MLNRLLILLLFIFLIIIVLVDLQVGAVSLNIFKIFTRQLTESEIIILQQIRIPRVLSALSVGISLPLCGLMLQTLLRNPLAGPYILGINSGASLGIAIVLLLPFTGILTNISVYFAAIAGAIGVLVLIIYVSSVIADYSTILVIGILISSIIASTIDIMQFFSQNELLKRYVVWTMGSLDGADLDTILLVFPVILFFGILSFYFVKKLDIIYLGDENAQTLGINVRITRISIFALTGILTGLTTAICGPISFIGLAVPHIARMIFRTSSHLWLFGASVLLGSSMMLLSDIVSHLFGSVVLPINSITSLWGIPVVLFILLKIRK